MGTVADISKWQGNVNWSEASKELDFCILRASCGESEDTKFMDNVNGCVQYGVPFGAYHYVKAGTATAAVKEARFFFDTCQKAQRQPVFYIADIEYEAQTADTTEAVCVAFLNTLRGLGCQKIGLYINTRYKWARSAIDLCDIMWIPHWGPNDGNVPADKHKPSYPHDLWQYTSKGTLAGVKGNVDLSMLTGTKPMSYFISGSTPEEGSEPTMLTNLQLAAYALAAFARLWVYWYGTYGNLCTQSRYEAKKKQYPDHYTDSRKSGYAKDIADGKTCAGCVGLIKAFFWSGGQIEKTPTYKSNGCPDVSANGMFNLCKETGPISTIPDIPGLIVWKSGHIGVYVGGGYTVEMKGFAYDCVKAEVKKGPWTHWGKLPESMLQFVTGSVEIPKYALGDRTIKKGDAGDDVKELQEKLLALGFTLPKYGADGDFGGETQKAVKAFQASAGLDETGVFDAQSYKALVEMLNPPKPDLPDEPAPEAPEPPDDKTACILIISGDEEALRAIQKEYGGDLAEVIV